MTRQNESDLVTEPDRVRLEWWLVLFVAAAILAGCIGFGVTVRLDNALYDWAERHISEPLDPRILLVSVDEKALEQAGAWPWPRRTVAHLLDILHADGAHSVALDMLLLEATDQADDTALAAALRRDGAVYLPVSFEVPGHNGASHEVHWPLSMFRAAAAGLGHVNLAFDEDGAARRVFLVYRETGGENARDWPQLVSLMTDARSGHNKPFHFAATSLVAEQPVMIPFAGPGGTLPMVSAGAVLAGEVPPALLRGRYILVGATASGMGDAYATPVSSNGSLMPGIEIQGNLLNALLTKTAIHQTPGWALFLVSLLPLVLLHVGMRQLAPHWTLPVIGVLFAATTSLSVALLWLAHLWLPPASALVCLIGLYPFWTWRRLAAVSAYMSGELEKLDRERDRLERPRPQLVGGDPLARQMGLLRLAMRRERDVRRFFIDRIAQMPDAVLVTDRSGKVVLVNAGARQLYALLGGPGEPCHASELLAPLSPTGQGETPPLESFDHACAQEVSVAIGAQDSSGRTYDVRYEPQRAADGQCVGFVVRIADTTTQTLMYRQREDVLELLSHDMRSPQMSILALLDHAGAGQVSSELGEQLRGYVRRTLTMADDFVHLSRAELAPIVFEIFDLASIIQDAVEALWPQATVKAINLQMKLPDEAILVRCDPSLLARAVINLVGNALKFSPSGTTIRIELDRTDNPVNSNNFAICRVIDEGPGIASDQIDFIFERFRRAPSGPMRNVGGSGLGLAFVHTVAMRLGGRVGCESIQGQGACFTIELPFIADDEGYDVAPEIGTGLAGPVQNQGVMRQHLIPRR